MYLCPGEVDGGSGNSDADYINHDDITPQSHRDVNGAPLPPLGGETRGGFLMKGEEERSEATRDGYKSCSRLGWEP